MFYLFFSRNFLILYEQKSLIYWKAWAYHLQCPFLSLCSFHRSRDSPKFVYLAASISALHFSTSKAIWTVYRPERTPKTALQVKIMPVYLSQSYFTENIPTYINTSCTFHLKYEWWSYKTVLTNIKKRLRLYMRNSKLGTYIHHSPNKQHNHLIFSNIPKTSKKKPCDEQNRCSSLFGIGQSSLLAKQSFKKKSWIGTICTDRRKKGKISPDQKYFPDELIQNH